VTPNLLRFFMRDAAGQRAGPRADRAFAARFGVFVADHERWCWPSALCFQLPVVLTLLGQVGIVSSQFLAEKRRYAIVLVFIVAAILTPPDVFSQLALAVPGILLYEASILPCG